jgi:hypothetical protein
MIAAIRRIISEDGQSVAQPEYISAADERLAFRDGDEDILELTFEQLTPGELKSAEEEILELTADVEEILELTAELSELPSRKEGEPATGLRVSEDFRDVTAKHRKSEHVNREPADKSFPATGTRSIDQHAQTRPTETPQLIPRSEARASAVLPGPGENTAQSAHEKVRSTSEEAAFSLEEAIATLRATQGLPSPKPGNEKIAQPNLEKKKLEKKLPPRGEKIPAAVLGLRARLEYERSIKPMIQQLNLKDFELLISLILERTGWVKPSPVGQPIKEMEFQVENYAVDERVLVQVKQSAAQSDLNDSAEFFRGASEYARLIFAVQSAADVLVCPEVSRAIHVWDCDRLAHLVSQLGLGEWVEKKLV